MPWSFYCLYKTGGKAALFVKGADEFSPSVARYSADGETLLGKTSLYTWYKVDGTWAVVTGTGFSGVEGCRSTEFVVSSYCYGVAS